MLIILATVSINAVMGDDGIIKRAELAGQHHANGVKSEEEAMNELLQEYANIIRKLEGEGTEENPYVIDSIEDLCFFSYNVNQGNRYEGKYVILGTDLDFNSIESYEDAYRTNFEKYGYAGELKTLLTEGDGFETIGINDSENESGFAGTFDGNGKVIRNVKIKKDSTSYNEGIGFFNLNYGTIKNLSIEDCLMDIGFTEAAHVGGICGKNWGEIDKCSVSGNMNTTVIKGGWIGGTVGSSLNKTIKNSCNKMAINVIQEGSGNSGRVNVGGIVGTAQNTQVIGCYNGENIEVNILGSDLIQSNIGGIVGYSAYAVSNCYNYGNVYGTSNSTSINAGGLVGLSIMTSIDRCYNLGEIKSEMQTGNPSAGGIVGGVSKKTVNCYNLGKVSGSTTSGTPYVGGIVGCDSYDAENCYNIGEVSYVGDSTKYVGAMIGSMRATLTNSYFLNNTELNGIARNYSGTSQPTKVETIDEMPTVLEIMGDAFKADTNNINKGYPILAWQ